MEYANIIWNPYFAKDINLLERIQRSVTRIPKQIRNLSYEDRLSSLKLSTHQQRRKRGDLIELFKIASNKYQSLPDNFLVYNNSNLTRGHPLKLAKERCNKKPRTEFLSNRVFKEWNNLPQEIVLSSKHLSKYC
uniref:Uncharacterized protein n=1 Tax=Cacopsylla melanoneura TaxID=428564 RepID=A0A8D9FHF2_9HEMI